MRKGLHALLLPVLLASAGCVTEPMTYAQWKARQERQARLERIRQETRAMRELGVVFSPEEQRALRPPAP
jgi:hypothetical protein